MNDLKYPIGKFEIPDLITNQHIETWIGTIEQLPEKLHEAVYALSQEQLHTPYRPKGWTVWQLIHHIADSHLNGYIRFKLALTEDKPTIKPYLEASWARLEDTQTTPIEVSLNLLKSLHLRWVNVLKSLDKLKLALEYIHPEYTKPLRLDETIALYAWHGNHHLEHILALKRRNQW